MSIFPLTVQRASAADGPQLSSLPILTGPKLTATPNPIVVLPTNPAGTTILQWTLGSLHIPADLWAFPPGGDKLFLGRMTAPGSLPSPPIAVGQTYMWRLFAVGTTDFAHLYSTVIVTTTYPDLSVGCKLTQCIGNLAVTPHGTYADFFFTTSLAALAIVQVGTQPPQKLANGDYSYSGMTYSLAASPVGTQHSAQPLDLEPNTTYYYLISVGLLKFTNTQQQQIGTFKTLRRKVGVRFEHIEVLSDSDFGSEGELIFYFKANAQYLPKYPPSGEVSIDSGGELSIDIPWTMVDAPKTVTLMVEAEDDDCDFWDICDVGLPSFDSGSSATRDWATASTTITFLSGPGEEQSGIFTIDTGPTFSSDSVAFFVSGKYKVVYVP
jgi:hypothetical protein